jgi:hypothetical protein
MRLLALFAALTATGALQAQSLAARVTQADGPVQVIFPSRPDACGDGRGMLSVHTTQYSGDGDWRGRCVHGPARVVATVMGGEITRLRTYVGPVPRSDLRTLDVSAAEARAWLAQLVTSPDHVSTRVAQDAMLPLVLADAGDPSAILLAVARDDSRTTGLRRAALTHLAGEVNEHLGIADARADTDDDELRRQAVFALSQQGHGQNTAELMDVARSSKHSAARRDAIFWLGQTGDVKTVSDLYAELLKQ